MSARVIGWFGLVTVVVDQLMLSANRMIEPLFHDLVRIVQLYE